METKDGALVFLALLSVTLFTTLAYSVWHNGSEIAQLQAELQKVKESVGREESTSQNAADLPVNVGLAAAELPAMEELKLMPTHNWLKRSNEKAGGSALHRLTAALSVLKRSRRSAEPSATVQLLTDALSEIVGGELQALLDCDTDHNGTKCTVEPGPKGDRGPIGQRGENGDRGEQGPIGLKGDKGERGNLGYPGYKGEVGPRGYIGESGPTGQRGEKGEKGPHGPKGEPGYKGQKGQNGSVGPQGSVGPRGPMTTLAQNRCNWRMTTCVQGCIDYSTLDRATCSIGQYVAGFQVRANRHYIFCCPVA